MSGNAGTSTVLRARWVVPVTRPPIRDGAVEIADGGVVGLGPFDAYRHLPGEAVIDLGDDILMPGLINAHCHLDYTMMRKAIAPAASFAGWIQRINALKRSFGDGEFLEAIRTGFRELVRTGTTGVVNIGAFPHLVPKLDPPPIRTFWYHELLDIRQAPPPIGTLPLKIEWAEAMGISPHAPYTSSLALYETAARAGLPLTTHLAESSEEMAMFRESSGSLYDFLKKIGRTMDDCVGSTPVAYLLGSGTVPLGALLVHVNEVDDGDLPHLAGRPIVHCPRSHRFFGHSPFRWMQLAGNGSAICLGTDSLASNDSLDLFAELRVAREMHPDVPMQALLEAATVNPARALGRGGLMGEICPGAYADLILLPGGGHSHDPLDVVFEHRGPVQAMLVGGRPVEIP